MTIKQVYEKYKHCDRFFEDKYFFSMSTAVDDHYKDRMLRDFWKAIKAEATREDK